MRGLSLHEYMQSYDEKLMREIHRSNRPTTIIFFFNVLSYQIIFYSKVSISRPKLSSITLLSQHGGNVTKFNVPSCDELPIRFASLPSVALLPNTAEPVPKLST